MELWGIFGRGGHFWEIRRTNCRDGRIMAIGTVAQLTSQVAEMNSQLCNLSLQLLIILLESIMVLSQLVDVKLMTIQMIVKVLLLTIMHQHNLTHISSKVANQLFERVDLFLKIGLLFNCQGHSTLLLST